MDESNVIRNEFADAITVQETGRELGRSPARAVYERYEPLLADSGLSEKQKRELVDTLWPIMLSFVDLEFGIHPAQQACGQLGKDEAERTLGDKFSVKCKSQPLKLIFERAASGEQPDAAER